MRLVYNRVQRLEMFYQVRVVIFLLLLSFFPSALLLAQNGIYTIEPPSDSQQLLSQQIIEASKGLVGASSLVVNGKRFSFDCTGGVLASYYAAGIDLWPLMEPYNGNGVARLYKAMKAKGWNKRTAYPQPGDLIFWDNTYDKNANGIYDDYLTHVGLVISSDEKGNIEYFHHHIMLGFVIERMNLLEPDSYTQTHDGVLTVVNAPLRARGNSQSPWLAGQLFRTFGQAWRIVE